MCQFCKIEISSQCDYGRHEGGWVMWIWCAGIVASLDGADFISLPGLPGQFCSMYTEWGWGWGTQLRSCATNSELLQGTRGGGCRMINVPNQSPHAIQFTFLCFSESGWVEKFWLLEQEVLLGLHLQEVLSFVHLLGCPALFNPHDPLSVG